MDFETGKLSDVALFLRPSVRREYVALWVILLATSAPYVACLWYWPAATACVLLFVAYFQVLLTFATSAGTDTAHHIRFLLCGSNPIGMTGASSLLLGAVDSILDWREDEGERKRRPLRFWVVTIYKFAMTPIGLVLMASEYTWDTVLMRRPSLVGKKWQELFSMAQYHSLICPEKSNDIFYADLAFARFQNDPHLYQWNRMRAMVFELKHQQTDALRGVGVPETNIFLQDEISAYQTLKRLQLEMIEEALTQHYAERIQEFPCPPTLARALIKNAQPVRHYLRMRADVPSRVVHQTDASRAFAELLPHADDRCFAAWHVLRLLDQPEEDVGEQASAYVGYNQLVAMADARILERRTAKKFRFAQSFLERFDAMLDRHFEPASRQGSVVLARVPTLLDYRGETFIPSS